MPYMMYVYLILAIHDNTLPPLVDRMALLEKYV